MIGVKDDFFLFNDPIMFKEGFNFRSADLLSPSAGALALSSDVSRLTPPADPREN